MTTRSDQQSWVVNTLLAASGYEVLHPESSYFMAEIGYDPVDFDRVLDRVKTAAQMPKAFSEAGTEIERKAAWYAAQGFSRAARDLYLRASLLYGQVQYAFAPGDARKDLFRGEVNRCTQAVIDLSEDHMERIEVPFEGHTLYALLHLPRDVSQPVPLVLMLPGMDMYKEDWTNVAQRYYLPRGLAVLAVDGPGQGETLGNGLFVTVDNYERAMSQLIDVLSTRPEIDARRIGIWGCSMGSYWGLRTAATDARIKAVATAMGCYGDMQTIFEKAQPGFKANFMRMSDYTDEDLFNREVAQRMGVATIAEAITAPVLMAYGEFDELSTMEETIALFDRISAPKRLMVFEQEFHALGGVGAELIGSAADWLYGVLADQKVVENNQDYICRDGRIGAGSAVPPWWTNRQAQDYLATLV